MHLRDARVDDSGKIVAIGTIKYPVDEQGAFRLSGHDCVTIALYSDGASLTPSTAKRDPDTGFLIASAAGPSVIVPVVASAALLATLQRYSPTNTRAQLPGQEGSVSTFEGGMKRQPLSDWTFKVDVSATGVRFHLSAALRMLEAPEFDAEANYWPTEPSTAQRIEIDFAIDWVTRAALFNVPVGPMDPIASPSVQPSRRTLLETASISQSGRLCAFVPSGGIVELAEVGARPCLVLTRCGSERLLNGFLVGSEPGRNRFPQIWLNFLHLKSLMSAIGDSDGRMSAMFTTGDLGHIDNELRREIPSQDIKRAEISARIDPAGLTVHYRLELTTPEPSLPEEIGDSFTLPWGSLLLRYPGFLWLAHRRDQKKSRH